jgi:hypothetical protein
LALVGALLAAVCPSAFAQLRAPTSTPSGAADTTGSAPGPAHATGAATRLPHTTGAAPGTIDTTGAGTGTTGTAGAGTDTTEPAATPTDPTAGTTDPAAGATDPAATPTDPAATPTDPGTQPATDPAAATPDPAAGAADPVTQPGTDSPAGTTEPTVEPTEPAATNETSADAMSTRVASHVFASARPAETTLGGADHSACGPLACFDAGRALRALDPALADLSVLRGTTLIGPARGGPAAALAAESEFRPAPEAPESPARSQLSGGGGASPFGGGFSLSLFALLLISLAGLAPLLSERLIATSAPWQSVALVVRLERPG